MKILFIGNIANNAYLLAKFLREGGVEADVLCYNYYDIMGCPEWEDAEISGDWVDNEHPRWNDLKISGEGCPDWFVQGPMGLSIAYLLDKDPRVNEEIDMYNYRSRPGYAHKHLQFWRPSDWRFSCRRSPVLFFISFPFFLARCLAKFAESRFKRRFAFSSDVKALSDFDHKGELNVILRKHAERLKQLFSRYDIVQAHATDPIYPWVLGKRPYVALEHGTIRNISFQDNFIGEATRKSYLDADHVLITNADNLDAADRLGISQYTFLPHPVNEVSASDTDASALRKELSERLNSDYIILHPARQHWDEKLRHPDWEKGNDIFIRGFARFAKEVNPKAGAVFVEWGQKLKETKALLSELEVADRIVWVRPLPHIEMTRYIKACDIVADQFWLGAFGAITPKAMMCGRAVMLKLDEYVHRRAFPDLPPVLNAKTPDDVLEGLKRHCKDKSYRAGIERESSEWYWKHHSSKVITGKLIPIYENLICNH